MSKLKIVLLTLLVVCMAAGSVSAGTTGVSHYFENYKASLEAMGAARNVAIRGWYSGGAYIYGAANYYGVTYTLGQSLSSGSLLNTSLTNSAFTGDTINVCAYLVGGYRILGSAAPPANSTSYSFVLTTTGTENVASGNFIWLTNASSCNALGAANFPVQLSSMNSAGSANITMSIGLAGTTVDSSSTAQIANIVQEYTADNWSVANSVTIDYLGNTNGSSSGTAFVPSDSASGNLIANSRLAFYIGRAYYFGGNMNYLTHLSAVNSYYGANNRGVNAGLNMYVKVSLTDTASWAGVNRVAVYAIPDSSYSSWSNLACNSTNTTWNSASNAAANSPSGAVTLNVPAAGFNGSELASYFSACVGASNSGTLAGRTISGSYDIVIEGTGANDIYPATSYATWMSWTPNGYVGLIPWLTKTSNIPTYCLINNSSSSNASLLLDILNNDVSGYTSSAISLGSLGGRTSKVLAFNNNGVQIIDSSGTTTTVDDLSSVSFTSSASSRYAAKVSATTGEGNVTMSCQQTDPATGGKRLVPVLTGSGASTWRQ